MSGVVRNYEYKGNKVHIVFPKLIIVASSGNMQNTVIEQAFLFKLFKTFVGYLINIVTK